jgi:hypothetical protein
MRTIKESEEMASTIISLIHGLLAKNNLSFAVKDGQLILFDHDVDRYYKVLH